MPDIASLKRKYFFQFHDPPPPDPPRHTFAHSTVTPLIHASNYFPELLGALDAIGTSPLPEHNSGSFIYIAGWVLDFLGVSDGNNPLTLDGRRGTRQLIEILREKARRGVDVRVMGWIAWSIRQWSPLHNTRQGQRGLNRHTAATIRELRNESSLANKACLNVINHPAGSVHTKLVIIGSSTSAVGFTGGIDLYPWRVTRAGETEWHDVQAMVKGAAVQGLYDTFKHMWNEMVRYDRNRPRFIRPLTYTIDNQRIEAIVRGTPQVGNRALYSIHEGNHHCQSVITVPRFNIMSGHIHGVLNLNVPPISFGRDGVFEIKSVWRKAILAAQHYIYIEDQGFWSIEIMSWINQALRNNDNVKVIILTGEPDPEDPELPDYIYVALIDGLLQPGTSNSLSSSQINRVAVYQRDGTVHAKTTLIDDEWAVIGSANFMQRSLYTDVEHSITMLDPDVVAVRDYRVKLWCYHLGLVCTEVQQRLLGDTDRSFTLWEESWGTDSLGIGLPAQFRRISLSPMPERPTIDQAWYDLIVDPDSRERWRIPFAGDGSEIPGTS